MKRHAVAVLLGLFILFTYAPMYAHEASGEKSALLAEKIALSAIIEDGIDNLEMRVVLVQNMLLSIGDKIASVTQEFLEAPAEKEMEVYERYLALCDVFASVVRRKVELQTEIVQAKKALAEMYYEIEEFEKQLN